MKKEPAMLHRKGFDVPQSVMSFLVASTAAGNMTHAVSVKGTTCPSCEQESLVFRVMHRPSTAAGGRLRREFEVVARCRTGSCTFLGSTNGKFMLG